MERVSGGLDKRTSLSRCPSSRKRPILLPLPLPRQQLPRLDLLLLLPLKKIMNSLVNEMGALAAGCTASRMLGAFYLLQIAIILPPFLLPYFLYPV